MHANSATPPQKSEIAPRDWSTLGLALLLEALNEPCSCEVRAEQQCAAIRDSTMTDKPTRKYLRRYCTEQNHAAGVPRYHPMPECIEPASRWWRQYHEYSEVA